MGKRDYRYVAKAIPGVGWRIWNRKTRRWWGNYFAQYLGTLLAELNGDKDPATLAELCHSAFVPRGDNRQAAGCRR